MWFWSTEIWISIVLLLITLFLYKWWIYRKLPPGPWGVPLLGYLPFLDPKHTYLTLTQLSKKYGPIYSLNMGNILAIVLSDPKIIRQALNKDALSGRADLYLPNKIFDGYGLIMTKGTIWKQQRKFTVSCLKNLGATKFGPKRERMESLALSAVDNLAQTLSSSSDIDEGVDIWCLLRHTIGNVINQLLFGRSFLEDDPIWIKLQYLSDEGVSKMDEAGVVNFLPYLRIFPNYQKSINFVVDGLTLTHKIYENIINEHKGDEEDVITVYLKEMEKNCNDCNSTFTRKQLLFLLGDLFGAGLDTTARTFNWFLLYVASHPDIQAKLHQEIDFVCGDKPCKLDDIPRLPYLEACITESQRIRSVVPIGVPHGALEDCEFESYTIPKGSIIFPLQWAVHMDENIWPEPNLFKPERFLDDKGNFFKPDAFIPFQPGKRICVGEELAKIMLFLFSSNILKNFHIKLPPKATENGADPLEGHFDLVLLKPNQSNLIFIPRKLL